METGCGSPLRRGSVSFRSWTDEQERELRITEIHAILEDDLYEDNKEESELIAELEELESQIKQNKKKYSEGRHDKGCLRVNF